jgi:hypothetical protein
MIPFIRHKTASMNDGLPGISKMKYRNRIPEPGTTIEISATEYRRNKVKRLLKKPTESKDMAKSR